MTRATTCAQSSSSRGSSSQPASELHLASDEDLFLGVRRGSEAHFNALYQRYFQRIYSFIYVRLRNHADTEELTQETFSVVFSGAGSYGGRSAPLAWIYGVAKNTVSSHLRRKRIYGERLEEAGPEVLATTSPTWSFSPEEQLTLDRYAEELDHKLRSVSAWQAEAFYLRHVKDLSIDEICRRTERSNNAVRSGLYRVKRLLVEAGAEAGGAGA